MLRNADGTPNAAEPEMTPYSLYARHGGFLVICTKTLPDRERHSQFWRTNVGSERVSY